MKSEKGIVEAVIVIWWMQCDLMQSVNLLYGSFIYPTTQVFFLYEYIWQGMYTLYNVITTFAATVSTGKKRSNF